MFGMLSSYRHVSKLNSLQFRSLNMKSPIAKTEKIIPKNRKKIIHEVSLQDLSPTESTNKKFVLFGGNIFSDNSLLKAKPLDPKDLLKLKITHLLSFKKFVHEEDSIIEHSNPKMTEKQIQWYKEFRKKKIDSIANKIIEMEQEFAKNVRSFNSKSSSDINNKDI